MEFDFIVESWGMSSGEALFLAFNNQHDDLQSLLHFDRHLRKAYNDHEIPLILRRHSEVLGCSILEYLVNTPDSGKLVMARLKAAAKTGSS